MKTNKSLYNYITTLAIATGMLLLVPLIAMQFTDEVVWTLSDFVIMGILIFGTGLTYKLVTRKKGEIAYRVGTGLALAGAFLLVWMNGAVGIIGNEANPANMMYFVVLMIGIIGTLITRLQPTGMARALFAVALAQAVVPVIALIVWPPEVISWGAAGVWGVFLLNAFFVMLFSVSALFFRHAGDNRDVIRQS